MPHGVRGHLLGLERWAGSCGGLDVVGQAVFDGVAGLSGRPVLVGNSESTGLPLVRWSQAVRMAAMVAMSGIDACRTSPSASSAFAIIYPSDLEMSNGVPLQALLSQLEPLVSSWCEALLKVVKTVVTYSVPAATIDR